MLSQLYCRNSLILRGLLLAGSRNNPLICRNSLSTYDFQNEDDTDKQSLEQIHSMLKTHHRKAAIEESLLGFQNGQGMNSFLDPKLSLELSPFESRISPALVERVIQKCSAPRHGIAWKQALGFFHWATRQEGFRHSVNGYNEMLNLLGKVKQFDLAWELLNQMKLENFEISTETFLILIRRYVRAGLPSEAIHAFSRMEDFCSNPNPDAIAYANVLAVLCKKRYASEAQRFFYGFKDRVKPDVVIYTSLVNGWCRVHDFDRAFQVFAEMKEMGIRPNVYTYTSLIEGLCRTHKMTEAMKVFQEMVDANCSPNVVTVNSLIRAEVNSGNLDGALDLLDEMRRYGCQPDVITYNFLIRAHCKRCLVSDAVRILDTMINNGVQPNSSTFNPIFEVVAESNDVNWSHRLFMKMKEVNCLPNTVTYNILMELFSRRKSTHMVMRLRKEMDSTGCEANINTYRILITMFCQFGHWKQAYKLFKEMTEEKGIEPRKGVYRMVLEQLRKAGEMAKHEELVNKMDAKGYFKRPL